MLRKYDKIFLHTFHADAFEESIQRRALKIILANSSYQQALDQANLTSLADRRIFICKKLKADMRNDSHPISFLARQVMTRSILYQLRPGNTKTTTTLEKTKRTNGLFTFRCSWFQLAEILVSYIDTFYFLGEFYKNHTKFQRKSSGHGPLGQPLNPPLEVDGCCSSLLFSILQLARASFKIDTTSVTFFAVLFWPVWASCNEGGKSCLIAVLYVAQSTKRRTEDAWTWKWRNDKTSPLRRLEEKDMTKEKFHDTK